MNRPAAEAIDSIADAVADCHADDSVYGNVPPDDYAKRIVAALRADGYQIVRWRATVDHAVVAEFQHELVICACAALPSEEQIITTGHVDGGALVPDDESLFDFIGTHWLDGLELPK